MADASEHEEEEGLASQEAELSALDRDAQELARRGQARCRDEHCGKMVALPVKDKPHLAHALCKDHLTCNQTHTCQICKAWDQPIWDDFTKHLAHLADRRASDKLRDRERERKSKEQRSGGTILIVLHPGLVLHQGSPATGPREKEKNLVLAPILRRRLLSPGPLKLPQWW